MRQQEPEERGQGGSAYYYRPQVAPDPNAPAKVRALYSAIISLNYVFLAYIVLVVGLNVGIAFWIVTVDTPFPVLPLLVKVVTTCAIVFFLSRKPCDQIAFGMGWAPSLGLITSLLVALNSALCTALIGFVTLQFIALQKLRAYGVRAWLFGLRRANVEARAAELEDEIARSRAPASGDAPGFALSEREPRQTGENI